jgi:hypothetical protein
MTRFGRCHLRQPGVQFRKRKLMVWRSAGHLFGVEQEVGLTSGIGGGQLQVHLAIFGFKIYSCLRHNSRAIEV